MGFLRAASQRAAIAELPPAPRLPAALQTLAFRIWPVPFLERCRRHLGSRFAVHVLDMPPLVFLSEPSEIAAVLAAPPAVLRPGEGAELIAPLIGEGSFILCDNEERNDLRSALAPAFRRAREPRHAEMIAATVREEVATWPIERTVALYPRLSRLTLTVILDVLFAPTPEVNELGEQLLAMLSVARSFVVQAPRLRRLPGWHATWKRFQQRRRDIDALFAEIITKRREDPSQHTDVLEMLNTTRIRGRQLPDQEIADNLLSLLVAGHETTASALAWAFQLLAHNPEVQRRLAEEIDNDEGDDYLSATVLETLRRGPVFLFAIPRAVVSAIEIGGITYQPPAQILACTYLMHNNPALYHDPQRFRPERFIEAPPPALIWRPWGGGRRRCLGQHLAAQEIKTVLREVLSTHEVRPAHKHLEPARWRSAIVAPHTDGRVILRPRN